MSGMLNGWIYGIVGAAVISAITLTFTPEGNTKRVVAVVCGFVMLIALLRPIREFDYGSFRQSYARLRTEASEFSEPMNEVNENLTRRIIEEKYAAYILDKGAALGIEWLEVTVSAEMTSDGWWYPEAVTVSTSADAEKRGSLAYEIEAGLGIPAEELRWGDDDE